MSDVSYTPDPEQLGMWRCTIAEGPGHHGVAPTKPLALARAMRAKRAWDASQPDSKSRQATINGVRLLAAEHAEAFEAIRAMMPAEMDMEQLVGIIGNLCLSYGVTGKELKTFQGALGEFVELMHDSITREQH